MRIGLCLTVLLGCANDPSLATDPASMEGETDPPRRVDLGVDARALAAPDALFEASTDARSDAQLDSAPDAEADLEVLEVPDAARLGPRAPCTIPETIGIGAHEVVRRFDFGVDFLIWRPAVGAFLALRLSLALASPRVAMWAPGEEPEFRERPGLRALFGERFVFMEGEAPAFYGLRSVPAGDELFRVPLEGGEAQPLRVLEGGGYTVSGAEEGFFWLGAEDGGVFLYTVSRDELLPYPGVEGAVLARDRSGVIYTSSALYQHEGGRTNTLIYEGEGLRPGFTAGGASYFADVEGRLLRVLDGTLTELSDTPSRIQRVLPGPDGEILYLAEGRIWALGEDPGLSPRLSDTGCFADLGRQLPVAGALPFSVRHPSWQDGAEKQHFLVRPPESREALSVGALAVETFFLEGRPVETRVLRRQTDRSLRGFVYRWLEDGSEALMSNHVGRAEWPQPGGGVWRSPSVSRCFGCHRGSPLGLRPPQLGADFAAAHFDFPQPEAARLPRVDDEATPVPERAKAWLEVNCGLCHTRSGRHQASLMRSDLEAPSTYGLGLCRSQGHGEAWITPGDPEEGRLLEAIDAGEMGWTFQLLFTRPDPLGRAMVSEWLEGLPEDFCVED